MSLLAQDERLTRRVGAIVLVMLAASIVVVVFVYPKLEWGQHVRIGVYFHHIGGMREGAPLVVAGREIGVVESIALAPRDVNNPLKGDDGVVATVAIAADEAARITRGGDVFIASRGPLGARYLEIGPALGPGPSLDDDPSDLLGRDPPSLDRVLQRTWDNLTIAREFAHAVGPELDELRLRLSELAASLDALAPNIGGMAGLGLEVAGLFAEARKLRDVTLGGEPGLAKLDAVIAQARLTLAHAREVLDQLGGRTRALTASAVGLRGRLGTRGPAALAAIEVAIDRMRAAIDKIDPLLATVADIQARIARGEGSLGKLANDPEFPEDAKALGKIMKRKPWRIIIRPSN